MGDQDPAMKELRRQIAELWNMVEGRGRRHSSSKEAEYKPVGGDRSESCSSSHYSNQQRRSKGKAAKKSGHERNFGAGKFEEPTTSRGDPKSHNNSLTPKPLHKGEGSSRLNDGKRGEKVKRCFKCQGFGHIDFDCPNERVVTFIEESDHGVYKETRFTHDNDVREEANPTFDTEELTVAEEGEMLSDYLEATNKEREEAHEVADPIFDEVQLTCADEEEVDNSLIDGEACEDDASNGVVEIATQIHTTSSTSKNIREPSRRVEIHLMAREEDGDVFYHSLTDFSMEVKDEQEKQIVSNMKCWNHGGESFDLELVGAANDVDSGAVLTQEEFQRWLVSYHFLTSWMSLFLLIITARKLCFYMEFLRVMWWSCYLNNVYHLGAYFFKPGIMKQEHLGGLLIKVKKLRVNFCNPRRLMQEHLTHQLTRVWPFTKNAWQHWSHHYARRLPRQWQTMGASWQDMTRLEHLVTYLWQLVTSLEILDAALETRGIQDSCLAARTRPSNKCTTLERALTAHNLSSEIQGNVLAPKCYFTASQVQQNGNSFRNKMGLDFFFFNRIGRGPDVAMLMNE